MWLPFIIQPKFYLTCIVHTVHIIHNTGAVLNDLIYLNSGIQQIRSSMPEYTKLQHTTATSTLNIYKYCDENNKLLKNCCDSEIYHVIWLSVILKVLICTKQS